MTSLTPEDHVLDGGVEREDESSNNTAGDHEECEQDEKKEKSEAVVSQRTSTATLLFNLAGSLCFVAGSFGFIWSTWTGEWLHPYQYGCNLWVLGCILFLLPLLALLKTRCCDRTADSSSPACASYWTRAQLFLVGCLLCFAAGCALGATGWSEYSVVQFFPPINALFLAGSALLLVDSLWVAWSYQKCISFNKLACCLDDKDDDIDVDIDSAPFPFIGLVVSGSYVFASVLGGYGQSEGVVQAGMFGWLVGSVVSLLETVPELYQRYGSSRGCCKSNASPRKRVSTTKKKPYATQASAV
jgi:hypothetical protein